MKRLDVEICCDAEMDEFWSFVENKTNQRQIWYIPEKQTIAILSWRNRKRTDEDFKHLLKQMENIPINKYYTDDWGAYSRLITFDKHVIGKSETWKIERKNLNFRIHLKRLSKKTICYLKNETIHYNVIGTYIEKFYYRTGLYGNN